MRMPLRLAPALAGLALATMAAGCSDNANKAPDSTKGLVNVVATTTQVADFARQIGGDQVKVTGLIGVNVDPHEWEPTPVDLERIGSADVVVSNGLGIEPWLKSALSAAGGDARKVVSSDGVAARGDDPHVWHDPANAEIMVKNIAVALEAVDPAGKDAYEERLGAYRSQLHQLDADIEAQVSKLPSRKLVTDHDAFGYFVARYHFELIGSVLPSFDTAAEPSAAAITDLANRIRSTGVKAIFAETTVPAKVAGALAKEAGVKVVDGPDALYGDALGPPGSGADTYLGMMRHNLNVIVSNLS
jgi:ABC-type Zn uptake system ZnuABC Zn-binding protein ZnuA